MASFVAVSWGVLRIQLLSLLLNTIQAYNLVLSWHPSVHTIVQSGFCCSVAFIANCGWRDVMFLGQITLLEHVIQSGRATNCTRSYNKIVFQHKGITEPTEISTGNNSALIPILKPGFRKRPMADPFTCAKICMIESVGVLVNVMFHKVLWNTAP